MNFCGIKKDILLLIIFYWFFQWTMLVNAYWCHRNKSISSNSFVYLADKVLECIYQKQWEAKIVEAQIIFINEKNQMSNIDDPYRFFLISRTAPKNQCFQHGIYMHSHAPLFNTNVGGLSWIAMKIDVTISSVLINTSLLGWFYFIGLFWVYTLGLIL